MRSPGERPSPYFEMAVYHKKIDKMLPKFMKRVSGAAGFVSSSNFQNEFTGFQIWSFWKNHGHGECAPTTENRNLSGRLNLQMVAPVAASDCPYPKIRMIKCSQTSRNSLAWPRVPSRAAFSKTNLQILIFGHIRKSKNPKSLRVVFPKRVTKN